MHHVTRLPLVLLALSILPVCGEPETQSEYRQADTNFYLRGDLYKADPGALILSNDAATNIGGSYLINTRPHPPQFLYLQQTQEWLEPITPPNMPASLNCPSDAMQVREPQGDVQVALPAAPASFHAVRSGMTIPDGAVVRTGDNSSVAVLFGGVDSVRLAPNTQAAVQMKVTAGVRDAEVDIRSGMVFSKVGQRVGEREAYAVHTPFGIASAHGTDYVTIILSRRVDVWVAQGTVELASPDGAKQTTVSTGNEPLQVMRYPLAPNDAAANMDSAESLTALLNFIPMANQKLKALAERTRGGDHLTDKEKEYIGRIRKVVSLIKLETINGAAPEIAAPTPAPIKPVVAVKPPKPVPIAAAAPKETVYLKAKPVAAAASPAADKAKKVADTAKPKKAKKMAQATTDRLAPPPEPSYPRAKPVDAADLVSAPTVMSTPPPSRPSVPAATEGADPNSLGAPLNPFHPAAAIVPAPVTPPPPGATSSLGGVTSPSPTATTP